MSPLVRDAICIMKSSASLRYCQGKREEVKAAKVSEESGKRFWKVGSECVNLFPLLDTDRTRKFFEFVAK